MTRREEHEKWPLPRADKGLFLGGVGVSGKTGTFLALGLFYSFMGRYIAIVHDDPASYAAWREKIDTLPPITEDQIAYENGDLRCVQWFDPHRFRLDFHDYAADAVFFDFNHGTHPEDVDEAVAAAKELWPKACIIRGRQLRRSRAGVEVIQYG